MKKLLLLVLVIFLSSCVTVPKSNDEIIKVNDMEITKTELTIGITVSTILILALLPVHFSWVWRL
jgi:uncharacterized membrane protein YciS (DUF1049 family)